MLPRVGDDVWVERRKWPDSPHYGMTGRVLGEDEFGVWVGALPGSRVLMPDGSERPGERPAVWCLPRTDWFLLHFWQGHPEVDLYVDIATPPVWNERGARMVDLDFDVIVWNAARGGRVELVDVDEFEQHRVTLAYPESLIAEARRAAEDVLARVTAGDAPFCQPSVQPWLDRLLATP